MIALMPISALLHRTADNIAQNKRDARSIEHLRGSKPLVKKLKRNSRKMKEERKRVMAMTIEELERELPF